MEKTSGPIGVFDSGYGGLTVLKELKKSLPEYDYLYLGDNARAPYGTRSFDVVYKFTLQAVNELFNRGCSLVILACNTASAKALRTIQMIDLPKISSEKRVLGVIRPSTELIGSLSKSKHIGILATPGTVKSNSYSIELAKFCEDLVVVEHACPMWVPLIENNEHNSEAGQLFLAKDLHTLLQEDKKIDTVLLACTHYPLVLDYLKSILPPGIELIGQGEIVAESLKRYLNRHTKLEEKCTKNGSIQFLTTETVESFMEKASLFFGEEVEAQSLHLQ